MKPFALVTASSQGMGGALAREFDGVARQGSVTDPADIERFVTLATERYGRIDAVVRGT
jgi:hypothetical protein